MEKYIYSAEWSPKSSIDETGEFNPNLTESKNFDDLKKAKAYARRMATKEGVMGWACVTLLRLDERYNAYDYESHMISEHFDTGWSDWELAD